MAAVLLAMCTALPACTWHGTDTDPDTFRPGMRDTKASDKELQVAVRGTRAQNTGAFTVEPIGVQGSFDLAAGTQQVDFQGYEIDDGKRLDYVVRRLVVDRTVYFTTDYAEGDECWADLTGVRFYDELGTEDAEVLVLIDALKATSGSGHTFKATAPAGLLSDAFFGSDPSTGRGAKIGAADTPRALRVPVTVRTGAKAVALVLVDLDDVVEVLAEEKVTVADAFGEDVEKDYLEGLGEVRIALSAYGFPVTIEQPKPWDIGLDADERC